MKVLLVTTDFPPAVGGIQAVLYNTVCRFKRTSVSVVAFDHPKAREFDRRQIFPIRRVKLTNGGYFRRKYGLMRLVLTALWVARKQKAKVLLCGHPFTGVAGLLAKQLLGTPYVVWTHAAELDIQRSLLKRVLQTAGAVLIISKHTESLVRKLGVPDGKTVMIPYAPDCEPTWAKHSSAATQTRGRKLLLTVSRLDEFLKGHDTLLRAMPLIASKVPNVLWVVVGDGLLRSYYEHMARALGVQNLVHFTGGLCRSARDRLFIDCDIFVMLSRDRRIDGGSEGFGIAYLEASAFGKPVVAGRAGGAPEAVVDGVTGLLVSSENEVEVAEAIVGLLKDPNRAAELGRQGKERVRTSFTWERTAAAVEEVLTDIGCQ